jgi:hypothetical protein
MHSRNAATHVQRCSHNLHQVLGLLVAINDQLPLEEPVPAVLAVALRP